MSTFTTCVTVSRVIRRAPNAPCSRTPISVFTCRRSERSHRDLGVHIPAIWVFTSTRDPHSDDVSTISPLA